MYGESDILILLVAVVNVLIIVASRGRGLRFTAEVLDDDMLDLVVSQR